jgi:hypothetical protein
MAITRSQILETREALREARAEIDQERDQIEREVGLATLRLEATATYKRLVTTAAGLSDDTLAPLAEYVASLSGGETAERAVAYLDSQAKTAAKKASSHVNAALVAGGLAGVGALVLGIVSQAVITAENIGAALFLLVIGGGSGLYALIRGLASVSGAAQSSFNRGWDWANSLGDRSDHALARVRQLELALWRATGAGGLPQPFTAAVRLRARIVLGISTVLAGIGILLIGVGFLRAANNWGNKTLHDITTPTYTLPSTPFP